MNELMEKLNRDIQDVALEVVILDGEDIPAMGNILNRLCDLEEQAQDLGKLDLLDLTRALKGYLEKLILREASDLGPLEEGIDCLQAIYRSIRNAVAFEGDTSSVFEKLGFKRTDQKACHGEKGDEQGDGEFGAGVEAQLPGQEVSEEDREIIEDFVIESLENLGTIEVSLMELEQDPGDLEALNAIFRPFHTIKGISGFINLTKINKLSHSAENLFDKARDGELRLEGSIVDIILETVDMLKRMIMGVQLGLETGCSLDNGIDIDSLKNRLDEIHSQAGQTKGKRLGEILTQRGAIKTEDLEKGLERQEREPHKKIGGILVEEGAADAKDVISGLREQKRYGHVDLQVKVDTKKLDSLMDWTGELVIAQSVLRQNPYILSSKDQELNNSLSQLSQITSSLQTTAMSLRMVPIKSTFQKMVRLVRDLAKNSNKEVGLEMFGQDTEIDRNVAEELYEPMVHMIRNAVDHGIEIPEAREKAGKKKKGTIHLRAFHRGGNIIVEIQDDGRGLNKDRIIEKAKSVRLITDENKLTDSEIYSLIFKPGFSTAKAVTDISGRGVGMDVVKEAIEKLRGRVEINSRPGHGSTFVISLPLTLAIIEGMLVRVGRERYIIPALSMLESFRPHKEQYSTVKGKGEMILSRGNLFPLIRMARIFNIEGHFSDPWDGLVVTVEHEHEKMCLLLDELLGKEEFVIKSLGESLKHIKGIAGGAIMGDGQVGLILDMAGIFEVARNN